MYSFLSSWKEWRTGGLLGECFRILFVRNFLHWREYPSLNQSPFYHWPIFWNEDGRYKIQTFTFVTNSYVPSLLSLCLWLRPGSLSLCTCCAINVSNQGLQAFSSDPSPQPQFVSALHHWGLLLLAIWQRSVRWLCGWRFACPLSNSDIDNSYVNLNVHIFNN